MKPQNVIEIVLDNLAEGLAGKKELLIRQAINHFLDRKDWTLDEIKGRGELIIDSENQETFRFDGESLFTIVKYTSNFEAGSTLQPKIVVGFEYIEY